jgi:hypothetical protein
MISEEEIRKNIIQQVVNKLLSWHAQKKLLAKDESLGEML